MVGVARSIPKVESLKKNTQGDYDAVVNFDDLFTSIRCVCFSLVEKVNLVLV